MPKSRIFMGLFVALMVVSSSLSIYVQFESEPVGEACTSVIITGTASEGGYAILAKNRDLTTTTIIDVAQTPVYSPASPGIYASVMINTYWMGMNEKGLAVMNTILSELAFGGSGLGNDVLNKWIVQHCATVDDVCYELNNTGGPIGPGKRLGGTCIGAVDRTGKGAFIEVSGTGAYARFIVDGFDSEANHPRYYPDHTSGPSGRDQYALDIMNRIYKEKGKITYRDVVQKVMRFVNDKEEGSLPFNVTGEIPNDSTQSSFVAVSGNAAYDGKLNCFWGEYGNNPIVGLFVPTIVFAGTPPPQTQNLSSVTLENRAYARNGTTSYLPERVREIQSCLFPAEDHTFEEYENLISSIPDGLNDSELGSILNDYIADSVDYAVARASEYESPQTQLTLKLSGEFEYMSQENTKIKISALVTHANASDPVPGAIVTVRIYDPGNTLWVSDDMIEIDKGIQTWESNETVPQVVARRREGVFIVYATASKEGFLNASDIVEFRIDPPAGSNNNNEQLAIVAGVAFVMTATPLLAIIYLTRKPVRKVTKPQTPMPQPETKPQTPMPQPETKPRTQKLRKERVRRTRVLGAKAATQKQGRKGRPPGSKNK